MPKRTTHRKFRCKQPLQPALAGILLASVLSPQLALAEDTAGFTQADRRDYRITSGTLSHALSRFAGNAGILLTADARLTDGKTSQGLNGAFTPEEGLRKLLEGSGLTYRLTGNNAVTIKAADNTEPQSGISTLPTINVVDKAFYGYTDPYNKDYSRTNASTATKTDTPLLETPISVQVIPKAVINDQQAFRLDEATKNVSGVQSFRQLGVLFDNFIIRGFTSGTFNVYRDGLRLGQQSFELANLEQVEVLKGPPSTLYGPSSPGGLVNLVTKKPLTESYYSLTQQFGSFDLYRTAVDATGAVNEDKTLAYRINLVSYDQNSFRDFVSSDRIFVAPQLTWKPNDAFEVNFGYEYKKDTTTGDRGLPAIGNRPANVPISRFIGEPNFSLQEAESNLAHFAWTYKFNGDWKIQQRFVTNSLDTFNRNIIPISLRSDNKTINRGLFSGSTTRDTYATDINVNGKFDLFKTRHNVAVGFDYLKFDQDVTATFLASAPFITPLDIFNPVYGTVNIPQNLAQNNFVALKTEWFGLYFQDQIDFTDQFHFLFSGRHDWARNASGFSSVGQPTALSTVLAEQFSPRVGLLYEPVKWLSFYANWTRALGANNVGFSASGQPFAPEISELYEGGIKTQFFDGRLNSTLAIYHLVNENVLTADTSTPDPFDEIAIGKARSQGVEFDVSGEITDKLSVIGSYTYTDTKVTLDNGGFQGNRLPVVPKHSGSLWLTYEVLNGLKVGSGAFLVGQRQGNQANTFQLPGYARWDASLSYQFKVAKTNVTAQFNVNNVLDKTYYAYADQFGNAQFDIIPGTPRSFIGSIRVEY